MAGRGFGKTRTGAEIVRKWAESGAYPRIALIADDAGDARDVMIEGESGILSVCPRYCRPIYNPSKRRLTWPNGTTATFFAAVDPESLRGPQFNGAWWDEPAKARYADEVHKQLNMVMRLKTMPRPRRIYTTTPRPTKLIKDLAKRAAMGKGVVLTSGTTVENLENLDKDFKDDLLEYEGTRIGRQELQAEILEDVEGALWTLRQIEALRVKEAPEMFRVVVAIDPAVTATEESDETGIVAAGQGWCDCKGQGSREKHYFVLADLSIGRAAPSVWATKAVNAYHDFKADRLVAEANNGGEMIRTVIRGVDSKIPVQLIHATRGKITRAEPVSMLYEQGKVHHVGGLPLLEDQMTSYVPGDGDSPDRMDAMVWAITQLTKGGGVA